MEVMLNSRLLKELKKKASTLKSSIIIGKEGLNENQIKNIKNLIDKEGLIKIKSLQCQTKTELEKICDTICEKLDAEKIEIKGFTFTIFKKKSF
jgi:RNA-binding protein YhbY